MFVCLVLSMTVAFIAALMMLGKKTTPRVNEIVWLVVGVFASVLFAVGLCYATRAMNTGDDFEYGARVTSDREALARRRGPDPNIEMVRQAVKEDEEAAASVSSQSSSVWSSSSRSSTDVRETISDGGSSLLPPHYDDVTDAQQPYIGVAGQEPSPAYASHYHEIDKTCPRCGVKIAPIFDPENPNP